MKDILEGVSVSPRPWHCYGNSIGFSDARQECCGIPDSNGECCGSPDIEWEEVQIASTGTGADAMFVVHAVNTYEAREALIVELVEALEEAEEYFDQRADAEYFTDSPRPVGNEEMTYLTEIRDVLTRAKEVMKG